MDLEQRIAAACLFVLVLVFLAMIWVGQKLEGDEK